MNEISIKTFCEEFLNGMFEDPSRKTQIQAGWYDWFCKDYALLGKTRVLGKKVVEIADSGRFDKNTCYVFFKNNCPCVGPLYDQFSICDIETGEVLFCCKAVTDATMRTGRYIT